MGKGPEGGSGDRARRHTGGIVAAVAGAAAVATAAAAVAGWRQHRRRARAILPEDSLAGPPRAPGARVVAASPTTAVRPAASPSAGEVAAPTPPHEAEAEATVPTDGDATTAVPHPPTPPVEHPAPPAPPAARRRRAPRNTPIVAGLVLVLALGTGAMAVAGGDDEGAGGADPGPAVDAATATDPTTTTTAPVTAADAFVVASHRLTSAGSFSFTGTASATDVSVARPMLWLAVATTVAGEVVTPEGRLHEVSVAEDGSATETVAAGSEVWGRRAPTAAALVEEPYELLPALSGDAPAGRGAALLPWWLAGAVASSGPGTDELGRRTFQATVPAALMGVIERERPAVDATATLTLDDAGDPVRVEIVSAPDGPPFHLVFEIADLGVPVVVETPADATPATATTTTAP